MALAAALAAVAASGRRADLSDPADHAGRYRSRPAAATTIIARIVADKMSDALGQPIVVDNRGGAGGTVAARQVAKSAPDGYTLLLGFTATLAISPSLFPNAGYDPRKDFAPIGLIGMAPSVAGGASRRSRRIRSPS